MSKRKILAVTGARSEYDLLYSVYKRLAEDERFDFEILVTGPHLSEKFGYTAQYIEKDGFEIADKIFNLIDSDDKLGRTASIGHQITGLAHAFNRIKPDIVLVAGDREEAISVSLTGAYLNIPVAHFFGGDITKSGNIDNSTRYAASKYAHIHFPTLEEHKKVLMRLGEDEWRIFPVGNPALDRIIATPEIAQKEVFERLGVQNHDVDYCVLIQHSISTQIEEQARHIRITLDAILESGEFCFINYPNSDAGNSKIIKAYEDYLQRYPEKFAVFRNADRETYVNLLRNARFLIGNSSSGVVEVASLGLPAINIGMRQRGRIHGDNLIFVGNDKDEITGAIEKVKNDQDFLKKVKKKNNPYGDGNSGEKIVEILASLELGQKLLHKNITY